MSEKIVDTYFFDSALALEVALQKNRAETENPRLKGLQICYYDGEELKNSPKNCIHLPLDKIYSYFVTSNNRFPRFVSFINTPFSISDQITFNTKLSEILNLAVIKNNRLVEKYKNKIKKNKPDFSEETLRVFIPACRETMVMQYISKNVAKAFKQLGCKVKYHIQKSDMECCGALDNLKAQYKFNPHITFNINHLNNDFIHRDVMNFTWFQDLMPIFTDNKPVNLRKRDFIFTLNKAMRKELKKQGIERKNCKVQSFCIDTDIYKSRKRIQRKEKIVFIGSSYKQAFDSVPVPKRLKQKILYELLEVYMTEGPPSNKKRAEYCKKYKLEESVLLGHITNYIERDMIIKKIVNMNINLDFELYGYDWDKDEELKKYDKGILGYGSDISKIYNGAKYTLVSGGYILQQRILEGSASGSTPVVLDVRHIDTTYNNKFDNSMIFFKKPSELISLGKDKKSYNLDLLVKSHSYTNFAQDILNIIDKNINVQRVK